VFLEQVIHNNAGQTSLLLVSDPLDFVASSSA
jgi:hypothetical protein